MKKNSKQSKLTAERLRELLDYEPATGLFKWRTKRAQMNQGDVAGYINKHLGYVIIVVDTELYYAHRLAFLHVTGKWPKINVDHINNNRTDNRWENLREANVFESAWNMRTFKNSSGVKGVYRSFGKWQAKLKAKHKSVTARFETLDEAEKWIKQKREELHGAFCNHEAFPSQEAVA